MRPSGKTAIITGAGGGMGRASALLFAENGARLLLTDKNEESGIDDIRARAGWRGNVRVVARPEDLKIVVCGGDGAVHAMALPGYGPSRAVTRAVSQREASAPAPAPVGY